MPKGIYERRQRRLRPLEARFRDKLEKQQNGCWYWMGTRSPFGHGQLYRGGPGSGGRKLLLAHRVSWELHNGPIPAGLCVLHKCDVPWCVNPDHLFIGTKADNSADMVSKGRQKRGDDLPHTRLSVAQVAAIRACNGISQRQIAAIAGVSQSHVAQIRGGLRR